MATQFIGSVVIGTGLDTRGFAVGMGKLRSAASAINGPLNAGGASASVFARGIGSGVRNVNLLSAAGRVATGIVGGLGSVLMGVGRTASVVSLVSGLAGASILKAGVNWRKTWNQAQAVTAGTADNMSALKDRVFELGSSTKFTVSEVAGAVTFLGRAGNTAIDQLKLLPTVLDLATAADLDLPRTADLITNIAKGLRIEVGEIGKYSDIITSVFLNANVTLEHFAASAKKIGPLIAGYGLNFREMAVAIGLLGNAGVQGEESGVHLRRGLVNLSDTLSKMRTDVVQRLGLTWDQLDVSAHGYIKTLGVIAKSLLDVKGEFKSQDAKGLAGRLFGTRALSTHIALIGQLGDEYDDLSGKVENSAGSTKRTADAMIKGLEPFYRLQAAVELAKISISESGVLDTFASLAEKVSGFFNKLSDASEETRRLIFGIITLVTVGGPAIFMFGLLLQSIARVGQMFFFLSSLIQFIFTPLGLLTAAILAVVGASAYMSLKGVNSVQDFIDGSSPLISSLAGVVLGLVGFINAAISGDWATAWGYAKDVIADVAVVVISVITTLANTILMLLKNIVHFVAEHWQQISDSIMKALEWLFTNTEGWIVVFTLLMFTGIRNMAVGVLLRVVWMANKVFAAFVWLGTKLGLGALAGGLWGKLWLGITMVASVATRGIVAIAARFGTLLLGVFLTIGNRLKIFMLFTWLVSAFKAMFLTVLNVGVAFGMKFLLLMKTLALKLGPRIISLVARFSNPWVAAVSIIIAVIIAFKDELWRAIKGIGSVLKNVGAKAVEGFANVFVRGINKILNKITEMVQSIGSLPEKLGALGEAGAKALKIMGLGDVSSLKSFSLGSIGEVDLGENRSVGDAWREGSGGLNFGDFGKAATDAWDNFKRPFEEAFEAVKDLGSTALDFVTEAAKGFGEFATAVVEGDWKRVGEMAMSVLNATIGEAFSFLASIGGDLATSVLAPAGKATIKAALGGLGYVFTQLDLALQNVEALEDVDAEKIKASIYGILGGAGIETPLFTSDAEYQEIVTGMGSESDQTPEDRKAAATKFISDLVSDLKTTLADLFKVGDDGKPEIPADVSSDDLIAQMNALGYDVTELGRLFKDIEGQYTGMPEYDPVPLTDDLGSGGGSSVGRSLTGSLSDIQMKIQLFVGDEEIENITTRSWIDAARNGRFAQYGIGPTG